jgi:Ser/Thr protein kinase RdoA (MazF antagonist)
MTYPRPFTAMTSHRIDVIAPGWIRKDLSDTVLVGDARYVKSGIIHDPSREPAAYRSLLTPARVGPRCLSSGPDWVVVERLAGAELWQFEEFDLWRAAARALARTHSRLAAEVRRTPAVRDKVPFLIHDDALTRWWQRRAEAAGLPRKVLTAHARSCERLRSLPRTVIHGDAYASNIIVGPARRHGPEVSFVDWELIGLGPAVLDVAALVSGAWQPTAIESLADAYFTARSDLDGWGQTRGEWLEDLASARLHVCVQWLCWAPGWRPPAAHRHDWLADARAMAELT